MCRLLVLALFISGCSIGIGPNFKKINKNGAFLLTQKFDKDILCVKSEMLADQTEDKTTRCYYVTGDYKRSNWEPLSSTSTR